MTEKKKGINDWIIFPLIILGLLFVAPSLGMVANGVSEVAEDALLKSFGYISEEEAIEYYNKTCHEINGTLEGQKTCIKNYTNPTHYYSIECKDYRVIIYHNITDLDISLPKQFADKCMIITYELEK